MLHKQVYALKTDKKSIANGSLTISSNFALPGILNVRDEQWYLDNLRYCLGFYNSPNQNVTVPWGGWYDGENDSDWYALPVYQMMLNKAYYAKKQPNLNYDYLTKDVGSTNYQAQWTKGGSAASILDGMVGVMAEDISDIRISAEPLSSDAKSLKETKIEREELIFLLKPQIEKYLQTFMKAPQQAQDFKSIEEIKSVNVKDKLADAWVDNSLAIWERDQWQRKTLKGFVDATVCGATGIEHIMEGGYLKSIVQPCYNLVIDNRIDDDFNSEARFAGVIENLTPMQVFTRYPQLTQEQKEELSTICTSTTSINQLNNVTNFNWWNTTVPYPTWKDVTINVARIYWIAPKDIEGSDTSVATVYQAELIGNKYLVNYGEAENIIRNPYMPYVPQLPIQIYLPKMVMGMLNSFMGRIRDLQNELDAMKFKIMETVGRANGKCFIFYGDKIGQVNPIDKVYTQLKQMGITMISTSGNIGATQDRKIGQEFDMSLDPNIDKYIQVYQLINSEMEKFVSTTGQQARYIGSQASKDNAEKNAMGTFTHYDNYMLFIQRNLRMANHIKIMLYADGQLEDEAMTTIGEQALRLVKKCKNLYEEHFNIPIKLDDKISEEKRKELMQIFQSFAADSTDGYGMGDALKVWKKSKTWTTLYDTLKELDEEKKQDKQKAQEQQMQQRQSEDKLARDTALQKVVIPEQGKNIRADKANDARKEIAAMKTGQPVPPQQAPPQQGQQPQIQPQGLPEQQPNQPPQ